MPTLKLKPSRATPPRAAPDRPPIRGIGTAPRPRPTLAQAQTERAERAARGAADRPSNDVRQNGGRDAVDDPRPNVSRQARPLHPQRPTATNAPAPDRRGPRHREERDHRPDPRNDRPPLVARPPQRSDAGSRSSAFDPSAQRRSTNADRPTRSPGPFDRGPAPAAARPNQRPLREAPTASTLPPADDGIRLSKRMSALGIASRREADEWIPKGWVQVDGRVVDQLGARVRPEQRITVDARARFVQAQKVTVLLHKPLGYVSGQAEDGHAPASVLVQRDRQWHGDASGTRFLATHLRGLAPAGRLDLDSTGLLVLTQDGRIARQLIGDDSAVEKEYRVQVTPSHGRPVDAPVDLDLLRHGLELDGVLLEPAQVEQEADGTLRFVLREGRKRQIRRMCEAVGLQVVALQRVRIGGVLLGDLPPGQWRYLRGDEAFAPLSPASATPPAPPAVEP